MKVFGDRLKELRTEKRLSIEGLSKEVKISRSSICRWENNQAEITGTNLVQLAKYFGVSTDYLLGLKDY